MSEEQIQEQTQETTEGTWSGLTKTIVGTLGTVITGGGVWLTTILYGGNKEPKEETKTEQLAPAPVIVNVSQTQENKQKVENGGSTKVIERVVEKPVAIPAEKPKKVEEESW